MLILSVSTRWYLNEYQARLILSAKENAGKHDFSGRITNVTIWSIWIFKTMGSSISGLVKKHSQEWMCTKPRCNAIIVWLTFRMNGKMNNRNEWEFYFFCTWKKDRVDDIKLQLMISIYYSGKGFSFSRISWTFIFATEVWMGLHKGNHCSARMFVCVTRDTNLGKSKPMQRLSGR